MAMAYKVLGQVGRWALRSYEVDIAAGATTEIVAAVAGFRIRVVGCVLVADVAGSASILSATTGIWGDVPCAATGGFVLPMIPFQDVPYGGWMDTVAGEALQITTVTCTLDGGMVVAVES